MKVKALSLTQPWANMIAQGTKTIETRSWRTSYRGWLLICATRQRVPGCPGPYGVALALARLVDCREMTREDEPAAMCQYYLHAQAWVLKDVVALPAAHRFAVRGQLHLFDVEVPAEHEEAIMEALYVRAPPWPLFGLVPARQPAGGKEPTDGH